MSAGREGLVAAHGKVAAGGIALERAKAALASGRVLVDETEAQLDVIRADETAADNAMAGDLVQAMRQGRRPTFRTAPDADARAVQRATAERRHSAARRAVDELAGAVGVAVQSLEAAEQDRDAAIKKVLVEAAVAMTDKIAEHESDARAIRAQLGGRYTFLASLPLPPAARKTIDGTDFTVNTVEWRLAQDFKRRLETPF